MAFVWALIHRRTEPVRCADRVPLATVGVPEESTVVVHGVDVAPFGEFAVQPASLARFCLLPFLPFSRSQAMLYSSTSLISMTTVSGTTRSRYSFWRSHW